MNPSATVDSDVVWFDTGRRAREQDAAVVLQHSLPPEMACGEKVAAQVVVRNTGQSTWTREGGFKLGVVDDEDPLFGPDARVRLSEDVSIPPGGSHAFSFELRAPVEEGAYVTDWQMVHESVGWFGETATQSVEVRCEEVLPDGPPPLNELVWLHTDISSWPETHTLSAVSVSDSQICLPNGGVHEWPVVSYDGVDVVGNPWIILEYQGTWYAATWEWLRPGQECKSRSAVNGDHIKQEPLRNWSPQSGERYWFMVSGLARSSHRNAEQRTNLVEVVWP